MFLLPRVIMYILFKIQCANTKLLCKVIFRDLFGYIYLTYTCYFKFETFHGHWKFSLHNTSANIQKRRCISLIIHTLTAA